MRSPRPRQEVFDIYWRFAAKRQAAFERRVAGESPPWSDDAVLQKFKFCNVFRASDRVSQFMIKSIVYGEHVRSFSDLAFQIIAFRMFSKIDTWRSVCSFLGHAPTIRDLEKSAFIEALTYAKSKNGGLYTAAFILCANKAYGKDEKHLNHVELLRHMFVREKLGVRLRKAKSLKAIFEMLLDYPLMGPFMAYQTAIDLNYSEAINFSENDFTKAGPGAIRGIRKVFEDLGDFSPEEAILWMVERQQREFRRLELPFRGLWGRSLHAIDCQGLFCETDKYCRAVLPALTSARKRIKAKFKPTSETIELFFPPKWGLNEKLPTHPVFGTNAEAGRLGVNRELSFS
jgi:hypothetical protein